MGEDIYDCVPCEDEGDDIYEDIIKVEVQQPMVSPRCPPRPAPAAPLPAPPPLPRPAFKASAQTPPPESPRGSCTRSFPAPTGFIPCASQPGPFFPMKCPRETGI